MDSTNIKVLIADDQPLVRMGFSMVLSAQDGISVVGEAGDGKEAIDQVAKLNPDIVLMDVRMPNMNGIDATEKIVKNFPNTKVLMLTTFDIEEYAFAALRVGASGFLSKDALPEQLIDSIKAVAAGDATISPKITKKMLELFANKLPQHNDDTLTKNVTNTFSDQNSTVNDNLEEINNNLKGSQNITDNSQINNVENSLQINDETAKTINHDIGNIDNHNITNNSLVAELTSREIQVLQLVANGYTNAEIAQELFVSTPTVKTHVSNILSKLNLRDRIQAVIFAYENSLLDNK